MKNGLRGSGEGRKTPPFTGWGNPRRKISSEAEGTEKERCSKIPEMLKGVPNDQGKASSSRNKPY